MRQYEAVIHTLERLGGQAMLAELYREALKVPDVVWRTKTPFASIRRIVQMRPEIFKVRPGLWALESHRRKLGLSNKVGQTTPAAEAEGHSYYQGLLATIGNLRGYKTWIPNQDKNRPCLRQSLGEIRTLREMPQFTYNAFVKKASTVDVSWFNDRGLPHSLFEVEHSTDVHNSLIKFVELQDFNARMVIVAAEPRRREVIAKLSGSAFREIASRVAFYGYEAVASDFEHEARRSEMDFVL